jgi:hypothetical protein
MLVVHALFCTLSLGIHDAAQARVACSRLIDGHWQVCTVDLETGETHALTSGEADKRHPTWSPGGDSLLYADNDGRLFRVAIDGGEPEQILGAHVPIAEPALSTEGRLAYVSVRKMPGYLVETWTCALDGSERRLLTRQPARDLGPSWSPDGRRLAVAQHDPQADLHRILVTAPDGAAPEVWWAGRARASSPAFSPDGGTLAFALEFEGNNEICVQRYGDKVPTRLTYDPSIDASPGWSPDGATLLFVSRRSGSLQLWTMGSDGSRARRVPTDERATREPAWWWPQRGVGPEVSEVLLTRRSLDPRDTASAEVSFRVAEPAAIRIELRGLRGAQSASTAVDVGAGAHVVPLPKVDAEKRPLADDVYMVRLTATAGGGTSTTWEPTIHSGGRASAIERLELSDERRAASCVLPTLCWVRARFGLADGPLVDTPLDWIAHGPGLLEIPYAGRSAPGWASFWDDPDRHVWVSAYTLPDNAVLYQTAGATLRLADTGRSMYPPDGADLFVHAKHDPRRCRDPKITASIVRGVTSGDGGLPMVDDRAVLVVDALDEPTRDLLESSRFEVIVWVDGQFLTEDEDSAVPFHFTLPTTQFPEGEHAFLVNVGAYGDHMGAAYVPFRVKHGGAR